MFHMNVYLSEIYDFSAHFSQLRKKKINREPHTVNQGCGSGSWKRLNFCGSGSTLKKEVGSRSESVEKELEADAIFSKSDASGFSNWLQP